MSRRCISSLVLEATVGWSSAAVVREDDEGLISMSTLPLKVAPSARAAPRKKKLASR